MYPFDRLVNEMDLQRDTSRNAIFDVMLVLQNNGRNQQQGLELQEGGASQIFDLGSKTSKFDLLISIQEQGNHLYLSAEYNTDLYEKKIIEDLIIHYKGLLLKMLFNPKETLGRVNYLSEKETKELLFRFNDTNVSYRSNTVMDLFEERVQKNPDKTALIFEGNSLTYKQLNERSNILANMLTAKYDVLRTSRVGVMLGRSVESVIGMVAVLKTGACYVPIDYNYPSERIDYIIKDSGLKVIISKREFLEKQNVKRGVIVDIETFNCEGEIRNNPVRENLLDDASYIIYTSGSTGNPKGVIQTHRMMSNLIQWDAYDSGIDRSLKHLQYTSFSFDVSLQDYWSALIAGGTIYVASEKIRTDFPALWTYIVNNSIQVLSFPFSAFQQFIIQNSETDLQDFPVKYILCSGEQLTVNSSLQQLLEKNPKLELHNHYGPSETHVVTSYKMSSDLNNIESHVPIGKPISNNRVYILDEFKGMVPKGIVGELYISGDNLAIGYVNLKKETKERFIDNPYETGKLYRTGDQGYWRADGNIEFVGRKDDQVKIRGYRIELGEIEHALKSHKEIKEAIVLVRKTKNNEKELVAYITAKTEQNTSDLRLYLKATLPDYMLPSYFVQMNELPLTNNGKIDKRSLPDPEEIGLASGVEYVAPRSEMEKKIVKIWQEVLQRDRIGMKDDFFALGGHSLKAIRLVMAVKKEFNLKLNINSLFHNTTVELFTNEVERVLWLSNVDEGKPDNNIIEI
jgi:amino acid adenylation domain-containing protein